MARFHSIITVTQGGILYRDIAEVVRWIDFRECQENHLDEKQLSGTQPNELDLRCIARCSFYLAPLAYIEFFTHSILRLEFEDPEQLWDLLKDIQVCGGWFAMNLD
jgi:hypothetical protein